ncbi:MAG TPA: division/cell wall cluster transcriptional repressor MraZ [bacterium]|nr:division/cell wall cluster transcriptional repressor MraZ [bacterium]
MFIGEFHHTLDEKFRFSFPKKFRNDLENGFVITRGVDNCLLVYTNSEWKDFANNVSMLPLTNRSARDFQRHILSGAVEIQLDKTGRAILPEHLRNFANIKKDIVIAGIGDKIEIWSEEEWMKRITEISKSSDNIANSMEGLGI